MKVQLAKLKADQEKSGQKGDHRVSQPQLQLCLYRAAV